MTPSARRNAIFVAGLLAGAVAAAVLFGLRSRDKTDTAAVGQAQLQTTVAGAAPAAAQADCSFGPLVASAGDGDGRVSVQKPAPGASGSAVNALIVSGKEAAAAGHARDAEVHFLNACRTAEGMKDDPMPLADAMYQLGRHYAQLASVPSVAKRPELLQRAESLYATSAGAYLKHRGEGHEKTRFAREGLAAVQRMEGRSGTPAEMAVAKSEANQAETVKAQAPAPKAEVVKAPAPVAVAAPAPVPAPPPQAKAQPTPAPPPAVAQVQPVPPPAAVAKTQPVPQPAPARAPAPAVVAKTQPVPQPAPARAVVAQAEPVPQPAPAPRREPARRTQPSFDCAKARSANERQICADEELAQADRDLGRLHQRAKQASPNPRSFQRDSDAEWARREASCGGDRECLLQWYDRRREQLSAAADRPAALAKPSAPAAVAAQPVVVATPPPRPRQAAPAQPAAPRVVPDAVGEPATASGEAVTDAE